MKRLRCEGFAGCPGCATCRAEDGLPARADHGGASNRGRWDRQAAASSAPEPPPPAPAPARDEAASDSDCSD
eukprot:5635287-Pyramimonas_sp.AAC.1